MSSATHHRRRERFPETGLHDASKPAAPSHGATQQAVPRSLQRLQEQGYLARVTPELEKVADQFAISISPAMLELMDPENPADPIAAQFMPSALELKDHPLEREDPIGDEAFSPVEGIVHRYPDRVLLKPLHLCAVYCRFCFRREQIGEKGNMLSPAALKRALDYIRENPNVWEVILSGGDPLVLSDARLADLIKELNTIPHVKIIRLHTRIPVVDPERITNNLITSLKGRAAVYVVLHSNHPRELTEQAKQAVARLVDAGIPMLSQSVLLKGINDDAVTLSALLRGFVENRIKPYQLHHPDLVRGTNHFRVALRRGQDLVKSLRGHLSGLCQPSYLLEIPGGPGKIPVDPIYARQEGPLWIVNDPSGNTHTYHDPAEAPLRDETS